MKDKVDTQNRIEKKTAPNCIDYFSTVLPQTCRQPFETTIN